MWQIVMEGYVYEKKKTTPNHLKTRSQTICLEYSMNF